MWLAIFALRCCLVVRRARTNGSLPRRRNASRSLREGGLREHRAVRVDEPRGTNATPGIFYSGRPRAVPVGERELAHTLDVPIGESDLAPHETRKLSRVDVHDHPRRSAR